MTTCCLALLTLMTPAADDHEKRNPLYRELRTEGLDVGARARIKLPAPLCADGLDAAAQQALLKKIVGEEFRYDEFTRNAVTAPNRLRLREVTPAAPKSVTRSVEVVFVAYGDLKTTASKDFLDRVLDVNRKEGGAKALPATFLEKRKLRIDDERHEGYAHLVFNLIDKVQLDAIGRSYWSESADSIVVAGKFDGRFRDDAEFPNRWRPLQRGRDGKLAPGKPHAYDGAGYYVKITRLAAPRGALFVEGHILFQEPAGWFEGTNLLRAKLPAVLQSQARTLRRELLKAAK